VLKESLQKSIASTLKCRSYFKFRLAYILYFNYNIVVVKNDVMVSKYIVMCNLKITQKNMKTISSKNQKAPLKQQLTFCTKECNEMKYS